MQDESVLGIVDGRKNQTRRTVKDAPADAIEVVPSLLNHGGDLWDFRRWMNNPFAIRCPYGTAGDRLWVKEAWRTEERESDAVDGIRFRADDAFVPIANTAEAAERWVVAHDNGEYGEAWRSPLFMPRWVSRITLELAEVRVQRLQEISDDDARAEGCSGRDAEPIAEGGTIYAWHGRSSAPCPRAHYATLWDRINRTRAPWASNLWVWALTFRRVP
jgi:hypothetical protein